MGKKIESTWSLLDKEQINQGMGKTLRGLAHHDELGYMMLESLNNKFLIMLGHPEYKIETLNQEWERDLAIGKDYAKNMTKEALIEMEKHLGYEKQNPLIKWISNHIDCM